MNTFLGSSENLNKNDVDVNSLKNSEYLLIEGYLVTSKLNFEVCRFSMETALKNNVKIILTLSDPNVVSIFRNNFLELLKNKIYIIFCNEQEAKNFSKTNSINKALEYLKKFADNFVVTLGKNGSVYFDGKKLNKIPADKIKSKDFTGAGDMFLAAFIGNEVSNFVELKNFRMKDLFSSNFLFIFLLLISIIILRIFFKNK